MIDHAAIGRIAARDEFRRNPDKTWQAIIMSKCVVCGGTIEAGQTVKRHRGVGDIRHADCEKGAE